MKRARGHYWVVVLLAVALVAGCAAQTSLGAVKETLLYNRELATGIAEQAILAHQGGLISDEQLGKVRDVYVRWKSLHTLAVGSVALAEKDGKWDAAKIEELRLFTQTAMTELVTLAAELGLIH